MGKREIRYLNVNDINDYLKIYFNSYPAFKDIGDEGHEKYYEKTLRTMERCEDVHFLGMFQEGKLIGTMKIVDFTMNLFGQLNPAAGLMALGVDPIHKKSGVALEMVKFFEEYTTSKSMSVALLLPFRADFYRRMGYGFFTRLYHYHLPMSSLPKASKKEDLHLENLRFLEKKDFDELIKCHEEAVWHNHGMLMKLCEEKRDMEEDSQIRRVGYLKDGVLMGYLSYNCVCDSDENYTLNHLEISELVYKNWEVFRTLLGFIRMQEDQAQSVIINTGEKDFYQILDNPQDVSENYVDFGYLQTNTSYIGIMGKIIFLEKFIQATDYRRFAPFQFNLGILYEDELTGETGYLVVCFHKEEDGFSSRWSVDSSQENVQVKIKAKKADIGSMFMGSLSVAALIRMGAIRISDEEYIFPLEQIFHVEKEPWSNTDF